MKYLKTAVNYIPLASFIVFVVTSGIASAIAALIFGVTTVGLLINEKRKKMLK